MYLLVTRILFEKSSNVLFLFLQKIFDKSVFNFYLLCNGRIAFILFKNRYTFYKTAHNLAKEKLIAYRNGDISADEFKKWFMDDEWMKL